MVEQGDDMPKHPDETKLEVDRSQMDLPPLEPTDEDVEAPEFEDMDAEPITDDPFEEQLDLPEIEDQMSDEDVAKVVETKED